MAVTSGEHRRVFERQMPAMLFNDFLHDRQPEAGAFAARGHIRFKQARAVFRQAGAIVGNGDPGAAILLGQADFNARRDFFSIAAFAIGFRSVWI